MIREHNYIHLQVFNKQFLGAEGGGVREVVANRSSAYSWETFTIIKADGEPGEPFHAAMQLPLITLSEIGDARYKVIADELRVKTIREALALKYDSHLDLEGLNYLDIMEVVTKAETIQAFKVDNELFEPISSWKVLDVIEKRVDELEQLTGAPPNKIKKLQRDLRQLLLVVDQGTFKELTLNQFVPLEHSLGVINHLDKIHIQVFNKRYVCSEGGGGGRMVADRDQALDWETFTIIKADGTTGAINHQDNIRLQAFNKQYVCAEGGGGGKLVTYDQEPTWEIFTILKTDGTTGEINHQDNIHLQASNKRYVCAEGGGGGRMVADRLQALGWETFTIIKAAGVINHLDKIHLQTLNGQYVCAEGGGGREVVANRDQALGWETFTIIKADGTTGAIKDLNYIHLQALNGQYVCAEGGGGREVVANRDQALGWETFRIIIPEEGK